MDTGKAVFAQLMDFLPFYEFQKCVQRYNGHYKVKHFSCWNQFLCMAFAQLTYRESLRDIEVCLRSTQRKLYHMGFRGNVSRNTLAHANQVRDWRINADFAQILIGQARRLYANDSFGVALNQTAYALDSTTIDLCLSLFPWAKFRSHKGAVKLYTLLDLRGSIPSLVIITHGKVHDVNILDQLTFEPGRLLHYRSWISGFRSPLRHPSSIGLLHHPNQKQLQVQTPLLSARRQTRRGPMRSNYCPGRILFPQGLSRKTPTHSLFRCRSKQTARLLNQQLHSTRINDSPTVSVSLADRDLLQMDQAAPSHQSILWNHRECRKTQIWIAIAVYVLVAIVKKQMHLDLSLYTILQILSVTLFEKTPTLEALSTVQHQEPEDTPCNQLTLFD